MAPYGNDDGYDSEGLLEIGSVLARLELTIGQASGLAGITPRQLAYWTQRGIIKARRVKGKAQSYDLEALRKILVIKRLMDRGLTLSHAVTEAEAILERSRGEQDNEGVSFLKDGQALYGEAIRGEESGRKGAEEDLISRLSSFEEKLARLEERLARLEKAGESHASAI